MNLCNISNVKRLLSEFNTGTKKGFGQNFLINEEIPYKIAEESYLCHIKKAGEGKSGVIEIGPGIGTLTCKLCERDDKVVAVEIDKTVIPVLDKTLSDYNNKEIIKDFVPGKEFLNVVFDRGGIRCLKNCYGGTEGTYYDYSLNKLFDFKCDYDNQGYFSENGCRIYYFERNKICMYNPENGSVSNVKPHNKMLITAINGVFTDM